jgi:hypothetical protein
MCIPIATSGINHSHLWDKPLDRMTPCPAKKKQKTKLNNKQGAEKEHAAEGTGCCKCTREGGRSKDLVSMGTFSKQIAGKAEGLTAGG